MRIAFLKNLNRFALQVIILKFYQARKRLLSTAILW